MSNVKILRVTYNPEELIEFAGRECYGSEMNELTRSEFIEKLIKMEHFSVIEHASVTFHLTGMSRACSHQLVRHRIASYSQRSQRFTKSGENDFVIPNESNLREYDKESFRLAYKKAQEAYEDMLSNGIKPEDARYVLPNGSTTSIVMTMNFSSLRHFFDMRISKKAQREIREFAFEMLKQVYEYAPAVFHDQMIFAIDLMTRKD